MKKSWIIFAALAMLFMAAGASADSLQVNNTAAMGGTGTACGGSNCGLEVLHDNTSAAYVQDNTPTDESVYRGSFLFNPNNISPETGNFRQVLFSGVGTNPNPGNFSCPAGANINVFRIWGYFTGGSGQIYNVQMWGAGNQCGNRGTSRISISKDQPVRICWEWTTGSANTGTIALATTAIADPCPTSGDGAWVTNTLSNQNTDLDLVRLGTPATNNFGVGENGSMYYDEFESFRTLSP